MEEQQSNLKPIILSIVITFVAVTLVVGGLVYFWQSSLVDEKQQSCDDQKEILMTQIDELKTVTPIQETALPDDSSAQTVIPDSSIEQVVQYPLKGSSFAKYLLEYSKYQMNFPPGVTVDSKLVDSVKIYTANGVVSPCKATSDGPCGFDLILIPKTTVKSVDDLADNVEFYIALPGGAGMSYYGPFEDDLKSLIKEAQGIK